MSKKESIDFCALFEAIEADPMAPVHITIRQHFEAADHVQTCATCRQRAERVVARYPEDRGIDISQN